jgi:hypothetical protein
MDGVTDGTVDSEAAYRRQTGARVGAQLRRDAVRSVESRRFIATSTGERGRAGMEEKQQGSSVQAVVHAAMQT